MLIGAGRDRGARTRWNGQAGWSWGPHSGLRWGTNRVSAVGVDVGTGEIVTRAFAMRFDPGETRHEAQAAVGDSGGAVFIPPQGSLRARGRADRGRELSRPAAGDRPVWKPDHRRGPLGLPAAS